MWIKIIFSTPNQLLFSTQDESALTCYSIPSQWIILFVMQESDLFIRLKLMSPNLYRLWYDPDPMNFTNPVLNCKLNYYSSPTANGFMYEYVQDINFWGSVYPTHFAIPHLMKTKGKIIVNASSAGVLHPPKGGFYNVTYLIQITYCLFCVVFLI